MEQNKIFKDLVEKGNPVGEVIGIDAFMVSVRGLQPANVHARVRFDNGIRGYVHEILEDHVVIMRLDRNRVLIVCYGLCVCCVAGLAERACKCTVFVFAHYCTAQRLRHRAWQERKRHYKYTQYR